MEALRFESGSVLKGSWTKWRREIAKLRGVGSARRALAFRLWGDPELRKEQARKRRDLLELRMETEADCRAFARVLGGFEELAGVVLLPYWTGQREEAAGGGFLRWLTWLRWTRADLRRSFGPLGV